MDYFSFTPSNSSLFMGHFYLSYSLFIEVKQFLMAYFTFLLLVLQLVKQAFNYMFFSNIVTICDTYHRHESYSTHP